MAKQLDHIIELSFQVMMDSGRNNPCAIEQLLTQLEQKLRNRINREKFPPELWFTLYGMISSHCDQEEVFTMGCNQMLKLGHFLIDLSRQIPESKLDNQGDVFLAVDRGTSLYFAAATLHEFIKRIDDNIRTQQEKIQILKKKNPEDNFDCFEIEVLGLMQLKLTMVQATEKFTDTVIQIYTAIKDKGGHTFLQEEDKMDRLRWGQLGIQQI